MWVESALGTPAEPVDVVADVLGGRESIAMVDLDQPDLSRQACGALSERRQAGDPARPQRRSPGGCCSWELELLLDAFEFGGRN